MQPTQLLADDDAVSPVIGVILMVAITVILAAVIGTFVLGLGEEVGNNAPQTNLDADFEDGASPDRLTFRHNGGDEVESARLTIKASEGVRYRKPGGSLSAATTSFAWSDAAGATTAVAAGDGVDAYAASGDQLNDATLRVVWSSADGDSSAELLKWDGPAA